MDFPVFTDRRASIKDRTTSYIAAIYTIGYFFVLWFAMNEGIPVENKDAINILLGVLSGIETQIVSYFFGASKGSENKDTVVAAALASQTDAVTAINNSTITQEKKP